MSFHSSVDSLHQLDVTTENMTKLMGQSAENEDIMPPEEVRKLLKLPENNTLSAYEDIHTIGVGGFGTVYAASEPGLQRRLAVKLLRPRYRQDKERIRAFIREARITAHIAHPNVVPVHQIGMFDDAGIYFSMKRVAGETLRSILQKLKENRPGYRKKYPLPRLLDIFTGACQGVDYAHQNGILHCDLKPENLMVGDYGEVLVMDWGMARCLPGAISEDIPHLSDDGERKTLGGTPVFMAPEHLSLSSNEPTIRSDIYALGCVLYSILTWKTSPFEGAETLEEIQKKVVQEKIIPPRHCAPDSQVLPRELESICLKAMARSPEKRYATVDALIKDLQRYRDGLPVDAYASSPIYKFGKLFFRHPSIPVTLILSLLVWCGFSLYSLFNEYVSAEAMKNNAAGSFRSGTQKITQAQKRVYQLKNGTVNLLQMQFLENAIVTDSTDAEASFKNTLDILERLPKNFKKTTNIDLTAIHIFLSLAEFYNLTENDQKLYETAHFFNERWPHVFERAQQRDPQFKKVFSHALSGIGTVYIYCDNATPPEWYIEDSLGQRLSSYEAVPLSNFSKPYGVRIRLPLGLYFAVVKTPDNKLFRLPLRSSLTMNNGVNLSLPSPIPEQMVFIPEGKFDRTPELSNNFRRRASEDGFLIKRTEVTVAEYLEFWNSLKDPALKERYASYYFGSQNSMRGFPSWDENGKLLRPGLTMQHPITGISGDGAEAYCRYLSKKLNRPVKLPSRSQWSKASGGIDGTDYSWGNTYQPGLAVINVPEMKPTGTTPSDCSIYGVLDLSGNVREFVKIANTDSSEKDRYAISGGSFFTHPEIAKNSNIVFSSRGGNDIGFRYVMPLEKPVKSTDVKND